MNHQFGPWTTSINAGQSPQLSVFWRRRLTRLPAVARSTAALGWPAKTALAVIAGLFVALPTLRGRAISAETGQPASAKTPAKNVPTANLPSTAFRPQQEIVDGQRPQGNCSISGKVVSAATGKPLDGARMFLQSMVTYAGIFIDVAGDGTFLFKDICQGPFLLTSHAPGYQRAFYEPAGDEEFSLNDGEHRTGVVLRAKEAWQLSGKVRDEKGNIPKNARTLYVEAWSSDKNGGGGHARVDPADGSYRIDGLSGKPVYLMAIDFEGARKASGDSPVYYPGTFSRSEAKLLSFDKSRSLENIDITLRKEGGLAIEGTVRDEAGRPIPEAFVVVQSRDMRYDFVTAYTDQQGRYRMGGLGDGQFLIHADAAHLGLARVRSPIALDGAHPVTQHDFTLRPGVTISGRLVDEKGQDWQIAESSGSAKLVKHSWNEKRKGELEDSCEDDLRNKHRSKDVREDSYGWFLGGEGSYEMSEMVFPSKSTFVIQGIAAGHTLIHFEPAKEHQKVARILYGGQNILESGLDTKPGQEIKDVTIVIEDTSPAHKSPKTKPSAQAQSGGRTVDKLGVIWDHGIPVGIWGIDDDGF